MRIDLAKCFPHFSHYTVQEKYRSKQKKELLNDFLTVIACSLGFHQSAIWSPTQHSSQHLELELLYGLFNLVYC